MTKKIIVLASGNGTNLQVLIDTYAQRNDAQVMAVFSDKADSGALKRAQKAGIAAHFIDSSCYDNREQHDRALAATLLSLEPDLIVLAGYMRILSQQFVRQFYGKIINIHPSLLPKYPGLNTYQRAIHAGDECHGTSIHFVTEQLDGGPVILQAKVPILDTDTVASLTAKVQQQEYRIYPKVVQWFIEGRLMMDNGMAILDGEILGLSGSFGFDEID